MIKQLIVYKRSAKLSSAAIRRLRDDGFAVLAVDRLSDVRIIDVTDQVILGAAMEAIAFAGTDKYKHDGPKTIFGRELATRLAAKVTK